MNNKNGKRISLDLDGVCSDLTPMVDKILQEQFPDPRERAIVVNILRGGRNPGIRLDRFDKAFDDRYYAELDSLPQNAGCSEGIITLQKAGYGLMIHSLRPSMYNDVRYQMNTITQNWLKKNGINIPFFAAQTLDDKCKAITQYSPEAHVDDSIGVFQRLTSIELMKGLQSGEKIYFHNTFNPESTEYHQVESWPELVDHIQRKTS